MCIMGIGDEQSVTTSAMNNVIARSTAYVLRIKDYFKL